MTQAERDRLVALKKAKKKLITQKQASVIPSCAMGHAARLRLLPLTGKAAPIPLLRSESNERCGIRRVGQERDLRTGIFRFRPREANRMVTSLMVSTVHRA